MDVLGTSHKAHRPSRTKKKNKKNSQSSSKKTAVAKPGAFARRLKLSADRAEKRAPNPTAPLSTSDSSVPRIVAVVGPRGAGKSTVIRNLVRHYTKRNVGKIVGPITVVTGKRKRITFVEVGGDLASMIDVAKVADLVLLVMDAGFGFEMETFEFLNILAAHGMPKVIGVLTHLDNIHDGKQIRKTKKMMKDRIWAEMYDGAKVFYLSGITTTGDYLKREVLNLARFISVAKFPSLRWRVEHSYLLADRVEDITPKSLPSNANRTVVAYGYVRGTAIRAISGGWHIHLAGVGDLVAENVEMLPDPCPTPEMSGEGGEKKRKRKVGQRDRVVYAPMAPEVDGIAYDRDAVYIELPKEQVRFSDRRDLVGDIGEEDEDSDGEGEKMIKSLQNEGNEAVDERLKKAELRLLRGGKRIISEDFDEERSRRRAAFEEGDVESSESEDSKGQSDEESESGNEDNSGSEPASESETEEDLRDQIDVHVDSDRNDTLDSEGGEELADDTAEDDEEIAAKRWKNKMLDNAAKNLRMQVSPSKALAKHIYKKNESGEYIGSKKQREFEDSEPEDGEDNDTFFRVRKRKRPDIRDNEDQILFSDAVLDDLTRLLPQTARDWIGNELLCARLKLKRFGTGQKAGGDHENSGEVDEVDDDNAPIHGDFEDLETDQVHRVSDETQDADGDGGEDDKEENTDIENVEGGSRSSRRRRDRKRYNSESESESEEENEEESEEESSEDDEDRRHDGKSRKALRDETERAPDPRKLEQERMEKIRMEELGGLDAETRIIFEGVLPGNYVRLELQDVPVEFVKYFDPSYPVVIGGLKPTDDEGKTYLRARIRRHRFKRGVLKSADPIVFSVGWRRFQSIPIYDTEDQGGRRRYLKYTPEYLHCNATFWAPSVAPGAGVVMCQSLGRDKKGFRIAGSGVITEMNTNFDVVKKLKLVGEPVKVHKNTAFIKGMFNSELEASKYIGASLRTVSGIRGTIKKAISEGAQKGAMDRDIAKSPSGTFRAGFEDKILLSDIVYLRAWVPVVAPKFCSIATTLLDKERSGDSRALWRMRTVREIRQAKELPIPLNQDSLYSPVERTMPKFAPLKIPKKLEGSLPYASKLKDFARKGIKKPALARKAAVAEERAVVLDPKEKSQQRLLQAVYTIRNHRDMLRKEANQQRLAKKKREIEKETAKHEKSAAERRKRKFALEGAKENRQAKRRKGNDGDDLY